MGTVVGLLAAFLKESLDTSLGTIEEIEAYLNIPVLGVIPQVDQKETERVINRRFPDPSDRPTARDSSFTYTKNSDHPLGTSNACAPCVELHKPHVLHPLNHPNRP